MISPCLFQKEIERQNNNKRWYTLTCANKAILLGGIRKITHMEHPNPIEFMYVDVCRWLYLDYKIEIKKIVELCNYFSHQQFYFLTQDNSEY